MRRWTMTFDHYQNIIAAKIQTLKDEKEGLENVDIDYNDPLSMHLEKRLQTVEKGLHDIETIAFFIVQQEEELSRLREENYALSQRVSVLRQQNERLYIRANACQSVAELHKSKWQTLDKMAQQELESLINAPDIDVALQELNLI